MFDKLMEYEFKKFGKGLPETAFGFIASMVFFSSVIYILENHKPMFLLMLAWIVSMILGFLGYKFSQNFVKNHK